MVDGRTIYRDFQKYSPVKHQKLPCHNLYSSSLSAVCDSPDAA